jgi:hypothetical protein
MSNDQLWSVIGKFLAIIAGVTGVIKIIEWLTSPKGKLTASIQIVPFVLPDSPKDNQDFLRCMWVAVVRNPGSKRCEEALFIIPEAERARIDRAGSDIQYRQLKDGIIELGTINPKEKITIYGWGRSLFRDFENVRLSSSSGIGKVLPRADAPKFCHDIEKTFPYFLKGFLTSILIGILFFILFSIIIWLSKPAIPPQANTSSPTNSSPSQITNTSSAN